jgi:putative two-component system response regulator
MNRTELTELLVSYRSEMSYARLDALISVTEPALGEMLVLNGDDDCFGLLNEVAAALGLINWRGAFKNPSSDEPQTLEPLAAPAHRLLLRLATEHMPRATPEKGISLATRALDIAVAFDLKDETRRGYNVCSALYLLSGAAADAMEHGLMAAGCAMEMAYPAAVVNALANVNGALVSIGLHEEALEIAGRTFDRYGSDTDCASDLALLLGNAAKAALALKRFDLAKCHASRTVELLEIHSTTDGGYRLLAESILLRCAIADGDAGSVTQSMNEIERLAAAYPSPRNELNRQFAEAFYVGYAENARLAMIGLLASVATDAKNFTAIYADALQQLCHLCSESGDQRSALLYAGKLVTTLGHARLGKVRERLIELGQTPKTVTPAKNSTQDIIDRIVSQALETQQTQRTRIATLGNRELTRSLEELAATAELCDDPSRRAIYRVGKLSKLLALELGHTEAEATALEHAARLHDIGKLGIPSAILARPNTRLNESEYLVMWRHAAMGAQILGQCHESIFALAAEIAHAHHEAWDGTGYPRNLQGEEIHEAARIVCLAENYDSMTHNRSYRHALTHPEAVEFISQNAGIQFDPEMTPVFIRVVERLRLLHGNKLDDWLAEDALANQSRHHHRDGEQETMLSRLTDLVPNSVFARLRGTLLDAEK